MEIPSFPTGIQELDRLIVLDVPDQSLISFCRTNLMAYKICQDPEFWRLRILKYFPGVIPQEPYRDHYLRLHSLAYDGILVVQDQDRVYVPRRISEIDLHSLDLHSLKKKDYQKIRDGEFIHVDYTRYGHTFAYDNSTRLLQIEKDGNYITFIWNESLWNELLPITFHPSSDFVISLMYIPRKCRDVEETNAFRHLTPQLEQELLHEAEYSYLYTGHHGRYYVMTPHGLVDYTYDPYLYS